MDFPKRYSYTIGMSRVTATIVLSMGGLLLIFHDMLNFRVGFPRILVILFSLWPNVTSGVGTATSDSEG
jgi:hypothetical protein